MWFTDTFFELWHSEWCHLFKISWIEILTLLIRAWLLVMFSTHTYALNHWWVFTRTCILYLLYVHLCARARNRYTLHCIRTLIWVPESKANFWPSNPRAWARLNFSDRVTPHDASSQSFHYFQHEESRSDQKLIESSTNVWILYGGCGNPTLLFFLWLSCFKYGADVPSKLCQLYCHYQL
jgi:hypothetical protein